MKHDEQLCTKEKRNNIFKTQNDLTTKFTKLIFY